MYLIDLFITGIFHLKTRIIILRHNLQLVDLHCVLVFDCSLVYTATSWLPDYCHKVQTELGEGKEKNRRKENINQKSV